ncbi:MAG: excinuclease ABC subunit UvrA [Ignavibacteria bacterium]|nr:excinuclease ABC subunit UvrA [Ignavibacteria bacterium]
MQKKTNQNNTFSNSKKQNSIIIRGARVHNLKNINVEIPHNQLVVITGVSGSGKSSLAFDTIYAEGQRRFVESLSSYARQFLERFEKPDVDFISGISPSVAIEQKIPSKNPRSTVGTSTEIYDFLRLLFARIGKTYCAKCGTVVLKDSVQSVVNKLYEETSGINGDKILVLFPVHIHSTTTINEQIEYIRSQGFTRIFHSGIVIDVNEIDIENFQYQKKIFVVLDRLLLNNEKHDNRLSDSLESAFRFGDGKLVIHFVESGNELRFNQHFMCSLCDVQYQEPEQQLFSFNTPLGACSVCQGFGKSIGIDEGLVVPDKNKNLEEGAIHCWNFPNWKKFHIELLEIAARVNIRTNVPYYQLKEEERNVIFNGYETFCGVNGFFQFLQSKSYKLHYRVFLSRYRGYTICSECKGSRLRQEALLVKLNNKTIADVAQMSLSAAYDFFDSLLLSESEKKISERILHEIKKRIKFLIDVGIGYLTLDRTTHTLSGGESQRIHLATALGLSLVGTLYVLDEPSIGLHTRDTRRLIGILKSLRDLGNTVIVVEHDREIIESADYIIDIGPNAGELGGEIVFSGKHQQLLQSNTLTSKYLSGYEEIKIPTCRNNGSGNYIAIIGAREHNLKNINVKIPLQNFVCVTGVSGSGKSTLVHNVIYNSIKKIRGELDGTVVQVEKVEGINNIANVALVDQSPIGKTSRSNPVTYIKAYDLIRDVFASTPQSKMRGYMPSHFSFNVSGGRCEACNGEGIQRIEMQFLAELELQCEVCGGTRFKKEILQIQYNGKNIIDVLNFTVSEAFAFFGEYPTGIKIAKRLRILHDVGLGYLRLGQSSTTLSGGETQRIKLASFLVDADKNANTLFIFDEPTTGLHFNDINILLQCFQRLLKREHSIIVIEHNLDVIKCADWIIDLGPEGGERGGFIIAEGTLKTIINNTDSITGSCLKRVLSKN